MSFCYSLHTVLPPVLEEEIGMSDTVILAQNSGDVVPAQSKVCLEAACSEKCLQAVQMSTWRWVPRAGSQLY